MDENVKSGHLFPWKWTLRSLRKKPPGGEGRVFSCFAGGGGSSMGWKLAGFDVVGCCEIDRRMAACYVANLGPRTLFCEPIQDFLHRKSLPEELFDLDVLDGSPPCSSFSMIGKRERDWGKRKKFREGQAYQVLDTLFFDFIELAKRLRPKVVVAENVPGLLIGNAVSYFDRIQEKFKKVGYKLVYRILDASRMGVPQRRRRLFIIGIRDNLCRNLKFGRSLFVGSPTLDLRFSEDAIKFLNVRSDIGLKKGLTKHVKNLMDHIKMSDKFLSDINMRVRGIYSGFTWRIAQDHRVAPTLIAGSPVLRSADHLFVSDEDIMAISSWPTDYDFCGQNANYVCGMSVPPVMMAQVACRIRDQWLRRLR